MNVCLLGGHAAHNAAEGGILDHILDRQAVTLFTDAGDQLHHLEGIHSLKQEAVLFIISSGEDTGQHEMERVLRRPGDGA